MKNFLKYFNLSKFYTLNIFLWLNLSLTILNYSQFYIILFFKKPLGIDTVSNLLVLEGQVFVVSILIFLSFFLFLIELILRKKNKFSPLTSIFSACQRADYEITSLQVLSC